MKKLFLIIVLLPFLGQAQEDKFYQLLMWPNDSAAGNPRYVSLPDKLVDLSVFSSDRSRSSYSHVVKSDSVYYKIFARYSKDSLPVFDFSKQELILRSVCTQCIVSCPTIEPCHRNACRYVSRWFVRFHAKTQSKQRR